MKHIFFSLYNQNDVEVELWVNDEGQKTLHITSCGDDWDDQHIDYTWIDGTVLDSLIAALTERKDWSAEDGYYYMKQNEDGGCTFRFHDEYESDTHNLTLSAEEQNALLRFL